MNNNMMKILEKCELCPHKCGVNRIKGEIGRCKMTSEVKIAKASLHYYEEPCISGKNGSGTVFFTGCNMSCKFCQNYKISQELKGNIVSINELADEFINLQNMNANNINLVTGVIYIPQIIEAIIIAKNKGLKIPIVYNSSGYENVETLKLLDGYIDIYLPDFKYYYNELGEKLSNIKNYYENATSSIKEMYRQVGNPIFDSNGLIQKGLIIRHLVLPNHLMNSKMILKWISRNMNKNVLVSVMAQYFPTYKASDLEDINRKLAFEEYTVIKKYIEELGINGFFQDLEENEEQYVPSF